MADVTLPLIIGAAVVDSINPCAFGVLIFLLAFLMEKSGDRRKILSEGMIYIAAVYVTYLSAGLLLLPIIRELGRFSVYMYYVLACIILLGGLLEIKDFFWYGKGFSLSIFPDDAKRIKLYVARVSEKKMTAFTLGCFVALVELPCTGAVYIAVLTLMTIEGVAMKHILYLLLYNVIFVLPLAVIVYAFYRGVKTYKFEAWRQRHKGLMRLITGLVLLGLGLWMILSV